MPISPQSTEPDRGTTEAYSPPDQFTPSHHTLPSTGLDPDETMSAPLLYSSASDGSLSPLHLSASDVPSHHSTLESLAASPSHRLTSDGPPSPSQPPETSPDNAKFLDKDVMKKIGIAAAVATVVGGAITAGILGLNKNHKYRDFEDS